MLRGGGAQYVQLASHLPVGLLKGVIKEARSSAEHAECSCGQGRSCNRPPRFPQHLTPPCFAISQSGSGSRPQRTANNVIYILFSVNAPFTVTVIYRLCCLKASLAGGECCLSGEGEVILAQIKCYMGGGGSNPVPHIATLLCGRCYMSTLFLESYCFPLPVRCLGIIFHQA